MKLPKDKAINHIFSGKSGKLIDTVKNRRIIENLTNNVSNYLGKDVYGKCWYAKTLKSGKQIYSYVQNGIIKGAGLNGIPRDLVYLKKLTR